MPKPKKESTKRKSKKKEEKNNTINLDNEIVIGLRIKEDIPKKKSTKTNQNKKTKNKKQKVIKNTSPKKWKEKQEKEKQARMKKFKVIKYVLLFIILVGCLVYILLSPLFNVNNIQVTGNEKISAEQIISLSQIEKQVNMFRYKKTDIKNNIKQNAYIDTVSISRQYPDTIKIAVTERKPAYLLEFANTYVLMSQQGYLLEYANEITDLPILTGFSTNTANIQIGSRLNNEDLQKLETVLRITEVIKNNELGQVVTKIDMSDKTNFKLILEAEQKEVYLGDAKDLSTKILYLKTILEKEQGKAGEIFLNMDINNGEPPMFRERV